MKGLARTRVALWSAHTSDLDAVGRNLSRRGFQIRPFDALDELRGAIERQEADLIVARLCRCSEGALELLAWLRDAPSAPPVVVATEGMNEQLYLEAMRRGAFDCVGLPLDENELMRIVSRALEAGHPQETFAGGRK